MRVSRKPVAMAVAGALALGGAAVVTTLVAPVASAATAADAADAADADPSANRIQAITDALAGLVGDGTITQEQAGAVAATLAESDALRGPGGHGRGMHLLALDVAASTLGLTEDELRTALAADGATLASIAEAEGVALTDLTGALIAAATERIQAEVADGNLDQAEADERIAALPDRVADVVQREIGDGPAGHGEGRRAAGMGAGNGAGAGA